MFCSDTENRILLCTGMDLCHLSIAGREGALVWICVSHVQHLPTMEAGGTAVITFASLSSLA